MQRQDNPSTYPASVTAVRARYGLLVCCCFAVLQSAALADQMERTRRVLRTPAGTRFEVFGPKPSSPAPTLFVFAVGQDGMEKQPYFSQTGHRLARRGWLYVTLDPPSHGLDRRADEPAGLSGWAHRVKSGQKLMEPFVTRCVDVLDFLIREGYTDPLRVAASGTSRGGFCALHFAAAEPRVRAVTCVSPITNLLALQEFAGVAEEQVRSLNVSHLAEKLAGRAIWLSIGNLDERAGTDDCIAAARQLVVEARRRQPDSRMIPVELVVGPSDGHDAVDGAHLLAAQFVLKQLPTRAEVDKKPPREK